MIAREVSWALSQGGKHAGQEANRDHIFLAGSRAEGTSGAGDPWGLAGEVWLPQG